MTTHIVIDMLYDFIDGSLACLNAAEAVKKSVEYINSHPDQKVLYVCDCHPADHCSFEKQGGIWPIHCVKGTRGGAIHNRYYQIVRKENRPHARKFTVRGKDGRPDQVYLPNLFYKGCDPRQEQYSGCEAVNGKGESIAQVSSADVVISGIATEYCVRETVLDLLKKGFRITLLKDALGYVDPKGHSDTLLELEKSGVRIL